MAFKDDVRRKTGAFLTSSQELFEKIFAQATRELKIKRKPRPIDQKAPTAPGSGTSLTKGEKPKAAKKTERTVVPPKTAEKVKASPAPKSKIKRRSGAGGGSHVLRASLLFVLLLVIAGFTANHFSIIDLSIVPDLLGLGPKPVVQAPIPRKQPAKTAEKTVSAPKQPQAKETPPTPAPVPSVPPPSAVSKEEKLVELETPTPIAQAQPGKERIEGKAPAVSTKEQLKPPEVAAKEESKPMPVQTQTSERPSGPEVAPFKPLTPQYPYSVYLGSFKAAEAVSKALSDYHEKGLSAYWARVDLGDKGVWCRFFAGYFRTKEEAENYIADHNIKDATPGITRYANLIGIYGSDKEAEDQKRVLVSAGLCPYVIKGADGKRLLYSGAFDRKEYAEKELTLLASKGIQSTVVER